MRGGDDADVDRALGARPDRAHGGRLEHLQQLGLQRRGHLADLVEQKRAVIGVGEEAGARGGRAREGALDVAEQLALEQVLGKGGAVDGDEWTGGAAARGVDRAGQGGLARAGLAHQQHRGRRVRDARGDVEDLAHRGAGGHQAPEADLGLERLAQRAGLATDAGVVEGASEEQRQLVEAERLGHVLVGALADRIHRGLDGAVRGHHDDRTLGGELARQGQQLHAVDLGHPQIGDKGVERVRAELLRGLDAGAARQGLEPSLTEAVGEGLGQLGIVVDD